MCFNHNIYYVNLKRKTKNKLIYFLRYLAFLSFFFIPHIPSLFCCCLWYSYLYILRLSSNHTLQQFHWKQIILVLLHLICLILLSFLNIFTIFKLLFTVYKMSFLWLSSIIFFIFGYMQFDYEVTETCFSNYFLKYLSSATLFLLALWDFIVQ